MEQSYQTGSTVKLSCTFYSFEGDKVQEPDNIKLIIYDFKFNKIEEFNVNRNNRNENGGYFFYYTIPLDAKNRLYYEWNGIIAGNVSLRRNSFKVAFI